MSRECYGTVTVETPYYDYKDNKREDESVYVGEDSEIIKSKVDRNSELDKVGKDFFLV